jgi:iron complex outermembrane receptor protein
MKSIPPIVLAVVLAATPAPASAQSPDSVAAGAATPITRVARLARSTHADTLGRVVPISGVEVSTTRPDARMPIARSLVERDEIQRRNVGLDTPMLLATLPGAYAYSDAGNGIGYSYLSIRGFPQRRISVLVNGVPLNDPESHEVYWIDHPDLLASTSEAQVQRGVGSALYGAASLGGSVNLETSPFSAAPHASITTAYGTFDTRRLMLEMGSGELAGGWNTYARYSRIETNGYRDRSDSRLWSYYLSLRHAGSTQTWRLNLYGGPEETHLAYLGVPRAYLDGLVTGDADRDRRFNPITYPGERDHFFEPHYELIHSLPLGTRGLLSQTFFFFDGKGYYDEQRFGRALADYRIAPWRTSDSTLFPRDYYAQDPGGALVEDGQGRFTVERFDVVRRRTVANGHYGWVPRLMLGEPRASLTIGGEIRAHDGHHYGEVISGSGLPPGTAPDLRYYDYHPRTLAAGLFARAEWTAARGLTAVADFALRHQRYQMRDDRFDGIRFDQNYTFALPRFGLTWQGASGLQLYGSYARSRREPALRDLFDGEGAGSVPLYAVSDVATNTYRDPLVRPERVQDWEAGARWSGSRARAEANLFRMSFSDELVYAGQFDTDLGYPIVGNAARSLHQGVELSVRTWLGSHRDHDATATNPAGRGGTVGLELGANASISDNHFVEYREVYGTAPGDTLRYDGKAIGFFPNLMANADARLSWGASTLGVAAQFLGRIYVDNTETRANSIAPHAVVNLLAARRLSVGGSAIDLAVRVLNALDERYETSGYMDYDTAGQLVPHLIPAATRAWLGQVTVGF